MRLWNLADGKLVSILDAATDMVSDIAANDLEQIAVSTATVRPTRARACFCACTTWRGACSVSWW